jgi:hypothetical protein
MKEDLVRASRTLQFKFGNFEIKGLTRTSVAAASGPRFFFGKICLGCGAGLW